MLQGLLLTKNVGHWKKDFTPVMLIHQEGQRSKKETEVIAAVNSRGGIEEYLSTTNSKETRRST